MKWLHIPRESLSFFWWICNLYKTQHTTSIESDSDLPFIASTDYPSSSACHPTLLNSEHAIVDNWKQQTIIRLKLSGKISQYADEIITPAVTNAVGKWATNIWCASNTSGANYDQTVQSVNLYMLANNLTNQNNTSNSYVSTFITACLHIRLSQKHYWIMMVKFYISLQFIQLGA
jgi:hypothetical protein